MWRCPPPQEILPNSDYDFGCESNGIGGTEGEISFKILKKSEPNRSYGEVTFTWAVPLIGSNSFNSNLFSIVPQSDFMHAVVSVLLTNDETFLLEVDGGSGFVTSSSAVGDTESQEISTYGDSTSLRFKSSSYQFATEGGQEGFI